MMEVIMTLRYKLKASFCNFYYALIGVLVFLALAISQTGVAANDSLVSGDLRVVSLGK